MADVKISALPAVTTLDPTTAVVPVVAANVTDKVTVQNLMKAATKFTVPTLYANPAASVTLDGGAYVKIPTPNAIESSVTGMTYDSTNEWWVNKNAYDIDFLASGLGRFECKCAGIKVILLWVFAADGTTMTFYAGETTDVAVDDINKQDVVSFCSPVRVPAGGSVRFYAMNEPTTAGQSDTLAGGMLGTGTPASYFILKQLISVK